MKRCGKYFQGDGHGSNGMGLMVNPSICLAVKGILTHGVVPCWRHVLYRDEYKDRGNRAICIFSHSFCQRFFTRCVAVLAIAWVIGFNFKLSCMVWCLLNLCMKYYTMVSFDKWVFTNHVIIISNY